LAFAAQFIVGGFAFLLAHKAANALRSWVGRLIDQCGLCEASQDFDRREYCGPCAPQTHCALVWPR
jgi:hypothetical protein